MDELQRWAEPSTNIVPSRDDRIHRREMAKVVREARLAALQIDAEAAVTGRIMERTVDIDAHRKQLANGDPVLEAVLAKVEIGFVTKAMQIQARFGGLL